MSSLKPRGRAFSLSADWDNIVKSDTQTSHGVRFPGAIEYEKPMVEFCTGSNYTGKWNALGMAGFGTYVFPHGVEYEGGFEDGMFHGDGCLTYPMGQRLEGVWEKGKLTTYKFTNIDDLDYQDPWAYCKMPDRRFNLEVREGLQPAGREFLTNQQPTRTIDEGCYDTGDGFYNPATKSIRRARDPQEYQQIDESCTAVPEEADENEDDVFWISSTEMVSPKRGEWIVHHCRRAWDELAGYRPDLYEDWISGRRSELEKLEKKYTMNGLDESDNEENEQIHICKDDAEGDEDSVVDYSGTGRKLVYSDNPKEN